MSTSFLNLSQPAVKAPTRSAAPAAAERMVAAPATVAQQAPLPTLEQDGQDFEIVFGRRQIAGTGLLLMVGLVCFSGVSYLIGRSAGGKNPAAPSPIPAPAAAQTAIANPPAVMKAASTAATPAPALASNDRSSVFSEAISGQVYIQVGAIDKGLAQVWAEGLRTHGLKAIVSSGPTDKLWRVLIGPLPDPQAYQQSKNMLDQLGIETFGRRYNDPPPAAAKPASPSNGAANVAGSTTGVASTSAPAAVSPNAAAPTNAAAHAN